jgi:signal transduction histidine kinase
MKLTNNPSSRNDELRAVVWVVDDSPLESEMAGRLLSAQHEVRLFSDGPSVLEQVAAGVRPDVLVLDWHMPDMSGLEVCRFLRQSHDEVSLPILILTATGGQDDLVEGLAAGANDFVTKSFGPAELLARVATLARSKLLYDRLRQTELATRRAREAAEEANSAKDTFLATVSHELRTPLNSILGWSQLLCEGEVDPATLKRGLDTIQRNALLQVQLIDDILDTTRVVSGKLHLELASVNLASVVRAAFDAVKPASDAKRLRTELVCIGDRFRVHGDRDRLQQAVSNLLTNAVKFTPADGQIRVELRESEKELQIAVIDSGKGIAQSFLPHVFDRFRQQDDASSQRHAGLGLGLALVQHIALAHGGAVVANSEGEGRGATFVLTLPRDDAPQSTDIASDRPTPQNYPLPVGQLTGLRVLVVEDDVDARDLLVTILTQQGAEICQAGSFQEALACLEKTEPELVLSDIGLPDGDGHALMRAVRARGHLAERLPAIALTAYARPEDRQLAFDAGFQFYVAKPIETGALVAIMVEAARARHAG